MGEKELIDRTPEEDVYEADALQFIHVMVAEEPVVGRSSQVKSTTQASATSTPNPEGNIRG